MRNIATSKLAPPPVKQVLQVKEPLKNAYFCLPSQISGK